MSTRGPSLENSRTSAPSRSGRSADTPTRRPSARRLASSLSMPISMTVFANCALSSAAVSLATMRPRSTTAMRSASRSASSRYCVVSSTVAPSATSSRITAHSSVRLWMSRPVVGSSRNRTGGRWTSAAATSRRRRIPPEKVRTGRSAADVSAKRSSSSAARGATCGAWHLRQAADEREVLAAGEVDVDGRALPRQADLEARLGGLVDHVVAHHLGAPAVGPQDGGQDAHGGRLAGAVGPEQAEDRAGRHLEVDAAQGVHVLVALR